MRTRQIERGKRVAPSDWETSQEDASATPDISLRLSPTQRLSPTHKHLCHVMFYAAGHITMSAPGTATSDRAWVPPPPPPSFQHLWKRRRCAVGQLANSLSGFMREALRAKRGVCEAMILTSSSLALALFSVLAKVCQHPNHTPNHTPN